MWDEIRPFVGAIVAVALCATNACVGSWEAVAWGMQAGALSGAAGALANGGDVLSGAAIGAFTALGYGAGDWLGGALVSGIAAESQGGQFLPAFAAAGVGAIFGGGDGVEGFMAATVGGGLASEITGGKFKNGAATGAFTWALRAGVEAAREPTAEEITYAKLAEGVYDSEFEGDDGYTRVKNHTDDKAGLQAALFVNKDTGHHVLAFSGTDPSSWANWKANLRQAFGRRSAQYEQGIDLAVGYHESTGGNIHFTGHSLGGGIASASAIVTGGSATVFNAAGVHTNTLRGFSPSNGSVNYIYSSFDVLRVGNMITPARVPGDRVPLGGAGLHGIRGVCREMGC